MSTPESNRQTQQDPGAPSRPERRPSSRGGTGRNLMDALDAAADPDDQQSEGRPSSRGGTGRNLMDALDAAADPDDQQSEGKPPPVNDKNRAPLPMKDNIKLRF